LVDGLRAIPDELFICEPVYDYLSERSVDPDSIEKYLFWSSGFYTRNLIYKDDRFELMAICWESGQVSRVHDHANQRCWMTVPIGRLRGQNFAVADLDDTQGKCVLRPTETFEMTAAEPAKVELEEPVHQILNLAEFGARAVSLHIYSKPYDRCLSYCLESNTFQEVRLYYTSIDGRLCDGVRL
jgi:cysteine dioxygenase